jgi:cbb3-type cytochrome oxidase maturation protein
VSVLYIVLPLAIIIAIAAVGAFIWMVRGGQMDDLDSPAVRMLHDTEVRRTTDSETNGESS